MLKKIAFLSILLTVSGAFAKDFSLLNVSYDPTRELYKAINKSFIAEYQKKTGDKVAIKQSHAGSGKQARAIVDGLEADVATLALAYDIDLLAKNNLISPEWQKKLPDNSSPYTSTIIFLVRKGNPKHIKDWDDIVKSGVSVITPNPKTSGGARWNHLAAYGFALKKYGSDEKAVEFLSKFYKNVPILDVGARAATTTFAQRDVGDVLVTWENDAFFALQEFGKEKFEVVIPSISILAEPPVTVIDKNAKKHGTEAVAKAYLEFLYTDVGQEIAAKNYYRPRNKTIAAKYAANFPKVELFTIDQLFGGWTKAQKAHFDDGGVFDKIYQGGK